MKGVSLTTFAFKLVRRALFSMLLSELLGVFHELLFIPAIFFSKITSQWVIGFWLIDERHQSLNHLISFCCWFPVFNGNDWQANLTFFVNIRVVDFRFKVDFGWFEWILCSKNDFDSESSFVEGCRIGNQKALP